MGVLDVEDRIVRRLPGGHGEIEVERAVLAAREEGEARGVPPHLLEQLFHQDEFAAALGHAHRLAVAQEGDELDDEDVEALRRMSERLHGRLDPRDVAVMVGPDQVHHEFGLTELDEVMESDVDAEVRQLTVGLPQHAVLVVAEGGGAEPEGAVLLVGVAGGGEGDDGPLGKTGIPHVALLVRPALEVGAVGFEHLALPRHHAVHGLALGPRGQRAHGRGVGGEPLLDEIHEVFARIGVLGQLGRLAEGLAQPHVHGAGEGLELVAGVVDVELALDGHALRAQDAREGIAHRGRAGIDDDERAGGIGGDELEEDATAGRALRHAVSPARGQDLLEGLRAPVRGKRHVQESRARYLERRDHRTHGEILSDRLGDLARRLAGRASQGKGDIGGIVAVAFLPRHFPEHIVRHRQPRFAQGVSEQRRQEFRD